MTNTETSAPTVVSTALPIKPFHGKEEVPAAEVPAVVPSTESPVRPIPREGLPKLRYSFKYLFVRFNKSWTPKVPKMNRSDQRKYDREQRIINIQQMTARNPRIVGTFNRIAAGKTPLTGLLSCLLQSITLEPVLAIDGSESSGTLNVWFDIEKQDTLLVRSAALSQSSLNTWRAVAAVTAKHTLYGVRLIASNLTMDETNAVSMIDFMSMVGTVKEGFQSVFIDGGNWEGHGFNRASADVADQMLFPALSGKPDSFNGLAETMYGYSKMGLGAKVKKGFIIINATRRNETKEFFLEQIRRELGKIKIPSAGTENGTTSSEPLTPAHFGITDKTIFLVPRSDYIANNRYILLDPSVIGFDTYDALLEILEAILSQDVTYRQVLRPAVPQPVAAIHPTQQS